MTTETKRQKIRLPLKKIWKENADDSRRSAARDDTQGKGAAIIYGDAGGSYRVDEVYAAGAKTEESIREYPVRGIVYFKQNLRSPDQVKICSREHRNISGTILESKLFWRWMKREDRFPESAEEEFGIASFPDMSEIGASGEPQKAYEVGDKIGTYLADLGFNMDFAPVADVLTNPENTVGQAFFRNRRSCDGSIFQRSGQGTAGSWHKRCPEALSGAWRHNGGQP